MEGRGTVLSIPVKQQTWRTEITETKKDNQLFQNLPKAGMSNTSAGELAGQFECSMV